LEAVETGKDQSDSLRILGNDGDGEVVVSAVEGGISAVYFSDAVHPQHNTRSSYGRKKVIDAEYYSMKEKFREAILNFFKNIGKFRTELYSAQIGLRNSTQPGVLWIRLAGLRLPLSPRLVGVNRTARVLSQSTFIGV
jgi:hypothetical protein